jgi:hypothetical protein
MDEINNKTKIDYKEELKRENREENRIFCHKQELMDSKRNYNSNSVLIIFSIALTFFMVVALLYAMYIFVHVTHISDLAGVHITPSVKQVASELTKSSEEKAQEQIPGYENWLVYKNDFFSIMYPQDWELKVNGTVTLKRYNSKQFGGRFDSLATAMVFGEFENPNNLSIKDVLKLNHRTVGIKPVESEIAGKKALVTDGITLASGLTMDGIYWALDKKVFYVETTYYDKQTGGLEGDCQKVVDSLKFVN